MNLLLPCRTVAPLPTEPEPLVAEPLVSDREQQLPDWDELDGLAEEFGDSFYVLNDAQLTANVAEFRSEFTGRYPATDIAYPYKTNHLPDICRTMAGLGVRAEIGSDMELWLAHQLGVDRSGIIFNGPNRSKDCLRQVMYDGGTVIVDSLRDLRIVEELARDSPEREFPLGLRVNFPLGERTRMRLGVDVDSPDLDDAVERIRESAGLRLAGLHCHFPDSGLDSFGKRTRALIDVAERTLPAGAEFLDVGGSFYGGVPAVYPGVGAPPSIADYADVVCAQLHASYGSDPSSPRLIVEPGTALVASAMSFITRVVNVKRVAGGNYANVAGSILDTSPNTRRVDFHVAVIGQGEGLAGPFDVGGSTLMVDEYLTFGVPGPLAEGDFVVFNNVGAYSLSMVAPFLRPDVAVLKRSGDGGTWLPVRRAATPADVFATML